jgi:hypothetical protein
MKQRPYKLPRFASQHGLAFGHTDGFQRHLWRGWSLSRTIMVGIENDYYLPIRVSPLVLNDRRCSGMKSSMSFISLLASDLEWRVTVTQQNGCVDERKRNVKSLGTAKPPREHTDASDLNRYHWQTIHG